MKFLIAGDSWGVGEWLRGDKRNPTSGNFMNTSHGGLAQYMAEDGHTVQNISQGSVGNTFISASINKHLQVQSIKNKQYPDRIIVFQTTYTRDYKFRFEEDWSKLTEANSLAHIWMARFYTHLSDLAQQYSVPVYLVGGLSDTVWLDRMQLHYPGVFVACQSMVNLLVNDESRVTDPVYSWYTADSINMIEEMRKILPADKFSDLMDQIDLGVNRQNMLSMYPEYFFPDGAHPNREGHNKLWQYLKEQDIV
jgi:hypothetical protein